MSESTLTKATEDRLSAIEKAVGQHGEILNRFIERFLSQPAPSRVARTSVAVDKTSDVVVQKAVGAADEKSEIDFTKALTNKYRRGEAQFGMPWPGNE